MNGWSPKAGFTVIRIAGITTNNFSSISKVTMAGFHSARNARIASAVLATAIPSVRLSVRHTPVLCQNEGT